MSQSSIASANSTHEPSSNRARLTISDIADFYPRKESNVGVLILVAREYCPQGTFSDTSEEYLRFTLQDEAGHRFHLSLRKKEFIRQYLILEPGCVVHVMHFLWTTYNTKKPDFVIPGMINLQAVATKDTKIRETEDVSTGADFQLNFKSSFTFEQVLLNHTNFVVECVEVEQIKHHDSGKKSKNVEFVTKDKKRVQITIWGDLVNSLCKDCKPNELYHLELFARKDTTACHFYDVSFSGLKSSKCTLIEIETAEAMPLSLDQIKNKNRKFERTERFYCSFYIYERRSDKDVIVFDGSKINERPCKILLEEIDESFKKGESIKLEFRVLTHDYNHTLLALTTPQRLTGADRITVNTTAAISV